NQGWNAQTRRVMSISSLVRHPVLGSVHPSARRPLFPHTPYDLPFSAYPLRPERLKNMDAVSTVDYHTGGEPFRIVADAGAALASKPLAGVAREHATFADAVPERATLAD